MYHSVLSLPWQNSVDVHAVNRNCFESNHENWRKGTSWLLYTFTLFQSHETACVQICRYDKYLSVKWYDAYTVSAQNWFCGKYVIDYHCALHCGPSHSNTSTLWDWYGERQQSDNLNLFLVHTVLQMGISVLLCLPWGEDQVGLCVKITHDCLKASNGKRLQATKIELVCLVWIHLNINLCVSCLFCQLLFFFWFLFVVSQDHRVIFFPPIMLLDKNVPVV